MKVNEFISVLASDAPAPGGGSASALAGAMGVGLSKMVAALTLGKPKYAEYEENRMKSDVDRNMATIVSPFTIVDLLDDTEVSLLHCGDYTRKTKFNSLDKSIYAMDNIYEVYGCLRPDVEIEDLEEIESIEYIVSRLGGNIIILSNRASMPKIVRDKLAENSVETFNPFN